MPNNTYGIPDLGKVQSSVLVLSVQPRLGFPFHSL